MKIIIAWLGILMPLVSLGGCIGCATSFLCMTDRHQVFLQRTGSRVGNDLYSGSGQSISSYTEKSLAHNTYVVTEGQFNGFKKLPNGNWELETGLANRACKIFFEYNPVRRLALSWRYEGSNDECWENDN